MIPVSDCRKCSRDCPPTMGIPGFWVQLAINMSKCIRNVQTCDHAVPVADDETAENERAAPRCRIPLPQFASRDEMECYALHVDTNGLVHPCTHDCGPRGEPESEKEMFARMWAAIRTLVKIAKPRCELHLALDGVAPRAKVNQQRARRYSSAHEADNARRRFEKVKEQLAKTHLIDASALEPEPRWDHNAISPGTPFMTRLCAELHRLVSFMKQLQDDDGEGDHWRRLNVVVSDAAVPGEGEHKIVARIRAMEAAAPSNQSHWIMGQDADLMVLGLALHLPRVVVLRHQLDYSHGFKPFETRFCLVLIDELRDLLLAEIELDPARCDADGRVAVVDDFVLLCNFIGNDFLPRIPDVDVRFQGLATLWKLYGKWRLQDSRGRLWATGRLSASALVRYVAFVRDRVPMLKSETHQLLAQRIVSASKRHRRLVREAEMAVADKLFHADPRESLAPVVNSILHLMQTRNEFVGDEHAAMQDAPTPVEHLATDDADVRTLTTEPESDGAPALRKRLVALRVREYLRGLSWVQVYYLEGCRNWQWEYRDYYAPSLAEIVGFGDDVHDLADPNEDVPPMTMAEQMLTILPPQSAGLLPQPLRDAVLALPPVTLREDASHAIWRYQTVVILPFVDRDALLVHVPPEGPVDMRAGWPVQYPAATTGDDGLLSQVRLSRRWLTSQDVKPRVRADHGEAQKKFDRGALDDLVSRRPIFDTSAILDAPPEFIEHFLEHNALYLTPAVQRELQGLLRGKRVSFEREPLVSRVLETHGESGRNYTPSASEGRRQTTDELIVAVAALENKTLVTHDRVMCLLARAHRVPAFMWEECVAVDDQAPAAATPGSGDRAAVQVLADASSMAPVYCLSGAPSEQPPAEWRRGGACVPDWLNIGTDGDDPATRPDHVAALRAARLKQQATCLHTTEPAVGPCRWTHVAPRFERKLTGITPAEWQRLWFLLRNDEPSTTTVVQLHAFLQRAFNGPAVTPRVARERLRCFPTEEPLGNLHSCPAGMSKALRRPLQEAYIAGCKLPLYDTGGRLVLLMGTTACPGSHSRPAGEGLGCLDAEDTVVEAQPPAPIVILLTDLRGLPVEVRVAQRGESARAAGSELRAHYATRGAVVVACCAACANELDRLPWQVVPRPSYQAQPPYKQPQALQEPLTMHRRFLRRVLASWGAAFPFDDEAVFALCALSALANMTIGSAFCKRRQRTLTFRTHLPIRVRDVTVLGVGASASACLMAAVAGVQDVGRADLAGCSCAVVDADLKLPRFHVDPHLVFDMNCRMLPFAYARYQMIRDAYHLQLRTSGVANPKRRSDRVTTKHQRGGTTGPIAQGRRST
jgi:hypothetical protein